MCMCVHALCVCVYVCIHGQSSESHDFSNMRQNYGTHEYIAMADKSLLSKDLKTQSKFNYAIIIATIVRYIKTHLFNA